MEAIVKSEGDGENRTHVGVAVCRGPGQFRLVLTRPYQKAGRVVEIPLHTIQSVEPARLATLGDDPTQDG